jgi:hypothetical protein
MFFPSSFPDKLSNDPTLQSVILTVYMYVGGLLKNAAATPMDKDA